jgi:hypothetical protein
MPQKINLGPMSNEQRLVKDMGRLCKRFPEDMAKLDFASNEIKKEAQHQHDTICKEVQRLKLVRNLSPKQIQHIKKAHDDIADWYMTEFGEIPTNDLGTFGTVEQSKQPSNQPSNQPSGQSNNTWRKGRRSTRRRSTHRRSTRRHRN